MNLTGISTLLLDSPFFYRTLRILSRGGRSKYVRDYVRPVAKDKILDIGCGPADILNYLPDVDYTGFDSNPKYIVAARKRFDNRGNFLCRAVKVDVIQECDYFDIVLANGVLHHLNDDDALTLFKLARRSMKANGRLVTLDCCYAEQQSRVARFLISKDRGKYARTETGYVELASKVFSSVKAVIRNDFMRLPYTHIIMECSK